MSVNVVYLMGRLGQDPDMKQSSSGLAICNLSIATTDRRKNKDGDYEEQTEWHRAVAFGSRAEAIGKFFSKGRMIHVAGRLQTRQWEDKDGNKRYTTEVLVDNFAFCGDKSGDGERRREPEQSDLPKQQINRESDDVPF